MKKSFLIILSMLLVLGFAATVFAIHGEIPAETQSVVAKGATQITLGGSIRFRGGTKENMDFNSDVADTNSSYDGRVRLSLDAQVSPKTIGRIQLESAGGSGASDSDSADTYTWGASGSDNEGTYGKGNGKRGDMRILEAWIQTTGLFGSPLGLKVGHMPLKLGNGLFFDHSKFGDDAFMLFATPTKELHVALLDIKIQEDSTNTGDAGRATRINDANAYVLLGAFNGGMFNASGDITYLDDQALTLHLTNIGLRGEVKAGDMVKLIGDVEIQSGQRWAGTPGKVKYRGYAFLVGADVNLNTVTVDAAIARGSGDKDQNDAKIQTFQTAQSDTQKFSYIYDYRVATAGVNEPSGGRSGLGAANTGIANTTYIKVGVGLKPTQDLSMKFDLYKLWATRKVSQESKFNSKDVGVEVDGRVKYNIDKNLGYFIEGGYLVAGNMYRNTSANNGRNPDDPWAVRHGVELTF